MDSKKKNRLERRKEATRKKLVEAAIKLFERQGFDATTMEQIAEQADVARKTLYNHFPVKEAILIEYIQRHTKTSGPTVLERLQQLPDTRNRIIETLNTILQLANTHQDLFRRYFAYRMQKKFHLEDDTSLRSGNHDYMLAIVQLGQETGELKKDLPAEALSIHIEIIFAIIIADMVRGKDAITLRKSLEEHIDIFLTGAQR